jgi:hypothetical protein
MEFRHAQRKLSLDGIRYDERPPIIAGQQGIRLIITDKTFVRRIKFKSSSQTNVRFSRINTDCGKIASNCVKAFVRSSIRANRAVGLPQGCFLTQAVGNVAEVTYATRVMANFRARVIVLG